MLNFFKLFLFILTINLTITKNDGIGGSSSSSSTSSGSISSDKELLISDNFSAHHITSDDNTMDSNTEDDDSEYQEEGEDYEDDENYLFSNKKYGDSDLISDTNLPIFLEEPKSVFVMRNKNAILSCKAVHALELKFKCSGNVIPPIINHDGHVDPHNGIQFIEIQTEISRNLVEEYFGKGPFQCECHAVSAQGSIKSQPAKIDISYIKKQFLDSPPAALRIEMGNRAELHCTPPLGIPTPNVTWIKNGQHLNPNSNVLVTNDNTLVITHASIQDMGNYSCVAENIAGRRVSDITAIVVYSNGAWSAWGTWTDCICYGKSTNGQKRQRTCTNPTPLNGGSMCSGSNIQKSQDCLICHSGKWSSWSEWSPCGYDCIQTKRRSCVSPDNSHAVNYDDVSERVVCLGRDFQSADCRGGNCKIDRDDTDWQLYCGLAIILFVCIVFGVLISFMANRKRHLSPYCVTRTDMLSPSNKQIGYDVVPVNTVVTASNYSYPLRSKTNSGKFGFLNLSRPLSEHLYDEPNITANFKYPSITGVQPQAQMATLGTIDHVSIDDSYSSSHYSRSFYSTESCGTSNNTCNLVF